MNLIGNSGKLKFILKRHLETKRLIIDRVKMKCDIKMLKNTFRSMNSINLKDFSKDIINL